MHSRSYGIRSELTRALNNRLRLDISHSTIDMLRTEVYPIHYYTFIIWVFQVNLYTPLKLKCDKTNIQNTYGIVSGIFIEKLVQLRLSTILFRYCWFSSCVLQSVSCWFKYTFMIIISDKFCNYIARFIIPSFPQLVNITEFNVERCNSVCLSNDIFFVFELGSIRLNCTNASKNQFVFHTTCTHFQ